MSDNPDPKIIRIIENAARFISKNGFEYEKEILAMPNNERFSFLNSSDPLHGVYKNKLTEYQNRPDHDDDDHNDDDDDNVAREIIEPPPGAIKNLLENIALYVAKYGLEEEKEIMDFNEDQERYNFMKRSDPFHAYYKHKVAQYRSQNPTHSYDDDDDGVEAVVGIPTPTYLNLPNFMLFILPKGMSNDEFDAIKRTAMFVGWYGREFLAGLLRRAIPQLEFLKPSHSGFKCFSDFVREYSKVLKPPTGLKQELEKNDAYLSLILDRFLLRLKWNDLQNQRWHEGGENAMIDWHASVTNDFANKDQDLPPPPMLLLGSSSSSSEPDPKRQKLDDSALVPPQDQPSNASDQVD